MRNQTKRRKVTAFTLVELLVVIVIISILMAFILVVAMDGVRRAEEKATQALIIKLDTAVNDRLEALLETTVDPTQGHRYLATAWNVDYRTGNPVGISSQARAQLLARFDQLKSELPDVFFVVPPTGANYNPGADFYPLNFAAVAYPPKTPGITPFANFILPLGWAAPNASQGAAFPWGDAHVITPILGGPILPDPGIGIFGASYAAAAGLKKNLGYSTIGFDGRDNNGDGLIDDLLEGCTDPSTSAIDPVRTAQIDQNLKKHTHNTARSEMLYALLVEGLSPMGSFLNRDDFTDKEVQDTDGDGMPEFVDAWGNPLQFYRWPIQYTSINDTQRGYLPYASAVQSRQQDPLDPNQLLVAPAWWSGGANLIASLDPDFQFANTAGMSGFAFYFHNTFHSLLDMYAVNPPTAQTFGILWDRSGAQNVPPLYPRRAYYSRFLIASAGLDKNLGIGQLGVDYSLLDVNWGLNAPLTGAMPIYNVAAAPFTSQNLILIENAAAPLAPFRNFPYAETQGGPPGAGDTAQMQAIKNYLQSDLGENVGGDDITNHNLMTGGGGVR
jgi:prepilin-type N-terminal cleavage/methylation domain-containing protein